MLTKRPLMVSFVLWISLLKTIFIFLYPSCILGFSSSVWLLFPTPIFLHRMDRANLKLTRFFCVSPILNRPTDERSPCHFERASKREQLGLPCFFIITYPFLLFFFFRKDQKFPCIKLLFFCLPNKIFVIDLFDLDVQYVLPNSLFVK